MTPAATMGLVAGAVAGGFLLGRATSRARRPPASSRLSLPPAEKALAVPSSGKKRRGLWQDVRTALAQEEGRSLIPAAFLAIAILDAIPTPTDVGYFYSEKWLVENRRRLSPLRFWALKTANYYGWDITWYLFLFSVTRYLGKSVEHQTTLGLGLVSTGAIAAVIWRAVVPEAARHGKRRLALPAPRRKAA
jgi:hypothetical protein